MQSETERGKVWLVLALMITIIPFGIWFSQQKKTDEELRNPYLETTTSSAIPVVKKTNTTTVRPFDTTALNTKIETVLSEQIPSGMTWTYGIAITDPITKQEYGKNEKEVYDAASTGKIAILATLYDQITNKKIAEDEKITVNSSDVQDYGTGVIRYKAMPATYSIRDLAELMIKQSDNTAAFVLANKIGRANIASYVKSLNMVNTDIEQNTTTPYDINLMLTHIYKLKDSDPTTAGTMLKIMTDSDFETRLPALLPQETIVAHKIGTGTAQLHDAGIVLLDKRPYIISIFSKNINDEAQAEKIIAALSKAVYEEFKKLE